MGRHLREALPAEIQETRARLDAWRRTRKSGMPCPPEIWSEAVEWARRFGINPVCRALSLSFTDLKKRMAPIAEVRQAPRAVEPTFIELERPGFQAGVQGGLAVEVASPDGARMLMRWPMGAAVDAGSLVASFLERR
jgi:hypothetical protein